MELPIVLQATPHASLQYQIYAQIRNLIINNSLTAGQRLPASRELSNQLNVSRNTVTGAYNKLLDAGYIESRKCSGAYVSHTIPENAITTDKSSSRSVNVSYKSVSLAQKHKHKDVELYEFTDTNVYYDFELEKTDRHAFPTKTWRRTLLQVLPRAGVNISRYKHPVGTPELRRAIAEHLGITRGMSVHPSQIIVTTGIQQGLNIVAQLFIRDNTTIAIEELAYRGATALFQNYGGSLVTVPIDQSGITPEHLPNNADLALIAPSRQYPMSSIVPIERRQGIINWAMRAGAYIVELDYDSDFMYERTPLPAIYSLDQTESVIYLGSFSKTMGPGLRMGYMVVPKDLVHYARSTKILLDYGQAWIEQAVMANFIKSGAFMRHLKWLRHIYITRRDIIIDSISAYFPKTRLYGLECGTHLVWRLTNDMPSASQLRKALQDKNVAIHNLNHSSVYGAGNIPDSDRYVLLGFSAIPEERIRDGILKIAATADTLRPSA